MNSDEDMDMLVSTDDYGAGDDAAPIADVGPSEGPVVASDHNEVVEAPGMEMDDGDEDPFCRCGGPFWGSSCLLGFSSGRRGR